MAKWVQFCSSDGAIVLYFDPVTKQIWGEGSDNESNSDMEVDGGWVRGETSGGNIPRSQDSPMEDFSDEDINAAARLASTVSPVTSITHREWPR